MKRLVITAAICILALPLAINSGAAQSHGRNADKVISVSEADTPPTFQTGGVDNFRQWIDKRFRYPEKAAKKNIEGLVKYSFVVDEFGYINDIRIVESPSDLLSDNTTTLLKSAPQWTPATLDGKPVAVEILGAMNYQLSARARDMWFLSKFDSAPQFPGDDFMDRVTSEIKATPEHNRNPKYSIVVNFTIDNQGKIKDPEILRSTRRRMNETVTSILTLTPQWIPAMKDGAPVETECRLYITNYRKEY